jgi:fructose/tagatose bisphosphate aldolase
MRGTGVLEGAPAQGCAVAGFVAYNMETAQGTVAAAEQTGAPVILQAGSSPFKHAGMMLATIALTLVKVNVNTELRRAFLAAVTAAMPEALAREDLAGPLAAGRDALTGATARIIGVLSPRGLQVSPDPRC